MCAITRFDVPLTKSKSKRAKRKRRTKTDMGWSSNWNVAKARFLCWFLFFHNLHFRNPMTSLNYISHRTLTTTGTTQPQFSSSSSYTISQSQPSNPSSSTTDQSQPSNPSSSTTTDQSQHSNLSPPPKMYPQKEPSNSDDTQATEMHLVMAWPPGFCRKRTCWEEVDWGRFYIHGLWMANSDGRHKTKCQIPFDPQDMSQPFETIGPDLIERSHVHWPSYQNSGEYTTQYEASPHLWRHEYIKHGSCARDDFGISLVEYFELILKLSEIRIEPFLSSAGILEGPSASTYSPDDFSRALQPQFGETNIQLACESRTNELTEIILCIDGRTRELMRCPNYSRVFKCTQRDVVVHRD